MGASVRNHTESKMAKLLLLLLPSLILADGPGGHHGHHHGGHHGDHGAHHGAHNEQHAHGAHNEDHAHPGGAVHHGDHGASHHPVQHTVVQSSQFQHSTRGCPPNPAQRITGAPRPCTTYCNPS